MLRLWSHRPHLSASFSRQLASQLVPMQVSVKQGFRRVLCSQGKAAMGSFTDIPPKAQKIVGYWLLGCAGTVFGTVVVGGITRLTESGLSITQWNVIKGMRPPRSQQEWEEEFERYKQFPEYKYLERKLDLEDFKRIFFWEYLHRMMGRTVGIVFGLPALYFLRKGWISKPMKPRLAIYFSLLLFQGALGWYMVRSGLYQDPNASTVPRVSQYRLAAHLSSAVVLYTLFLWSGLSHILHPQQMPNTLQLSTLRKFAHGGMSMIFLTLVSGAFVAGLDAGLVYNTWPKMADRWIPSDLFAQSPKWRNFFENATTTQFNHRLLGELTVIGILGLRYMCSRIPLSPRALLAANCLTVGAIAQAALGVTVLLKFVPVSLAASHQAGALSLLSLAVWLTHELRRVPK